MAKEIFLDFETRSELDLNEVGLDRYSRHPSTRVLMLAWAVDDGEIQMWFPHLTQIPKELLAYLNDTDNTLIAWNATFERVIFERVLGMPFPFNRWKDAMVLARSLSLPGGLEAVCKILHIPKEDSKIDGDDLIQFFSYPTRDTEESTMFGVVGRFNDWDSHPDKWNDMAEYCRRDVHAERMLWRRMNVSPLPESVWEEWFLDQKMNEAGMPVNRQMVENGLWLAQKSFDEFKTLLIEKTGLENPLSDIQMKEWLSSRGYTWNTLLKGYVDMTLKDTASQLTPEAREVLKLRSEAKKISYKKLKRLLEVLGPDDRLRYQFRFGGAARTLRWAGGDVQTQNLPRPIKEVKKDYQRAIDLIMARDYETIKREYPSVIGMVTSSLRMVFQAPAGKKMVVCDLNAIENRGLGYLARCPAILEVFRQGKCPYLSFATYLFNMGYAELELEYKNGNETKRQQAKAPVLGGGYGLGGGEIYVTEYGDEVRGGLWGYALYVCGVDMPQELAHKAVKVLRSAWPEVPQFWRDLENAFKMSLRAHQKFYVGDLQFDYIEMEGGIYAIRMRLPSGRYLHYLNPTIERETFYYTDKKTGEKKAAEGEVIYYDGIEHSATLGDDGARKKNRQKWGRVKTYGGKLCENATQAFCRDLLVWGMILADRLGFELVGCFHDELGALVDDDDWGLGIADLRQCMSAAPGYASDIPLGAEGFEGKFYRKG